MNKKIIDKEKLSPKVTEGMREIAAIVKRTLGPGGLPIIIQRIGQSLDGSPLTPKITKDGVSVADECYSIDEEKDLIIQTVKAICKKTNSVAGDGTTTAIVLGEAILEETLKVLSNDKTLNPQLVKESVEETSRKVLKQLEEMSIPVKDIQTIKQVASLSANGDESIGDIIGQAFDKVGAEGVVTIDEGHTSKVTLDVVDGYQFNRGAEGVDRFFNSKDGTFFEAEKARLVIYDGKLLNYTELIPVLQSIAKANDEDFPTGVIPPIVIIANEFSREVIQFLLIQRAENNMTFCAVRGPHMTTVRTGYYDDIAIMSGGNRIGNGGRSLKAFTDIDVGIVEKIVIDKYTTTLYEGAGEEKDILKRVDRLKALRDKAESPYDKQVVNDRLAALTEGIAKIGVGGATDLEIKEKYDRIEDALNASRAAIQQGVVPGCGLALYRISRTLGKDPKTIGDKILANALTAPFEQILKNIEVSIKSIPIKQLIKDDKLVYDARNKEIVNALDVGIIDPVKVTSSALENAVSIASLLSTVGGGIIYLKNKN